MVAQQFIEEWRKLGYTQIRFNLWRGCRLYVNLKDVPAFCYALDERHHGICYIKTPKKLQGQQFADAKKMGKFVSSHLQEILDELDEGIYYDETKFDEREELAV